MIEFAYNGCKATLELENDILWIKIIASSSVVFDKDLVTEYWNAINNVDKERHYPQIINLIDFHTIVKLEAIELLAQKSQIRRAHIKAYVTKSLMIKQSIKLYESLLDYTESQQIPFFEYNSQAYRWVIAQRQLQSLSVS